MFISFWMFLQFPCFEALDLIPEDEVLGPIKGPPLNGDVVRITMPGYCYCCYCCCCCCCCCN